MMSDLRNKLGYYGKILAKNQISHHRNLVCINPLDIDYFIDPGFYKESRKTRYVGGDWDKRKFECDVRKKRQEATNKRSLFRLKEYYLYKSMYERYINEIPWQETEFYTITLEKIEQEGSFWHGCKSERDLKKRCQYLDNIYSGMLENGYKSQKKLGGSPKNEVNINITRHGELILDDGRHRLIMAQLIGLAKIPAKITVIHRYFRGKLL